MDEARYKIEGYVSKRLRQICKNKRSQQMRDHRPSAEMKLLQ